MRSLREMLERMFLGSRRDWWDEFQDRERASRGGPGRGKETPARSGRGEEDTAPDTGAPGGREARPPLRADWRDVVAFTIAMYQVLAVPFLLFCGVALFVYFLLWLWAR